MLRKLFIHRLFCSGLCNDKECNPPGEIRGIHVNSASFLFKTRGELAVFMWFVRWELASLLCHSK